MRNLLLCNYGSYRKSQTLLSKLNGIRDLTSGLPNRIGVSSLISPRRNYQILPTATTVCHQSRMEPWNVSSFLKNPISSGQQSKLLSKSIDMLPIRSYCSKADDKAPSMTKNDQLKKAFKDYGSTIVIFHVGISLVSLGGFYLLVSSGIDVIGMVEKLGFSPAALSNSVAKGASNFVIAYAIHKVFAPVRISITLGATPFIVRVLRSKGILKAKK
ncbi:protein FAM210A-like [Haematobia irritans]|uniref:DUF1279 domain-containing protein n=1 Tax=Haematobia irritans TaxID=7368 RepID=A0A1L8EAL9_HAEIR